MPRDAPPTPEGTPARHQRADGAFLISFAPGGPAGGALRTLYQQAPLRILFPDPEPGDPPQAALVNCAGGLAGGDVLRQSVVLEPGARATLSSAAAEKIYRSLGGAETRIATTLSIGAGAAFEWIPQETILFEGARLARRMAADLAPGARLLAAETLVFGRAARGERLTRGGVLDTWRLSGPEGLRWADGLSLSGDIAAGIAAPFGLGGAEALGTLLLAGPGAETMLGPVRDLPQEAAAPSASTIPCPGLLLARWLGRATAVRRAMARGIVLLRAEALGLPPRLPRLWTT